ncbi:MAG: M15 family metallopeptidase [Gemmatimonadaceae bacterium]|nr:M15 family metallopeptidase [Gemmatimonadaceae bacterium]
MNVNTVFTSRPAPRPEPPARPDAASRPDAGDDERDGREPRVPARAEFSALLAMIAGAGSKVRADLLKQVPADGASLLDKLLDGSALDADATGDGGLTAELGGSSSLTSLLSSSQNAADALRYGILKDAGTADAADLDVLKAALNGTSGRSAARAGDEHAHLNEVIGRIVARRGASVDQLKARGDNEAAEVRAALDALLAQAGTPAGLHLAAGADNAALAAAATALASAKSASAADVTTPVREIDALAPELRQKLARVIERMKNEYGHDVDVVETARSQERQDFLYEQGRTRPGAVVTWTRDSAHTRGDAVDVMVDGKWNNADGFARLQRIAREEGLRTLGVRDPGHLEIASRMNEGSAVGSVTRRETTATPLVATAAMHSGVARVAGMAGVAGIARVAGAGSAGGLDRSMSANSELSAAAATIAGATGPASDRGQGNAFGRGERDTDGRPLNDGRKLGDTRRESLGAAEPSAFGALQTNTVVTASAPADASAPAVATDSASRVADLQQLRDNAPAGSVSRMTLNIDTADGGQDRITVDLRGTSVGTQISTDVESAERLRMRTAELQDALGRHGLDSDSVRISSAARSESNAAARVVGSEQEGLRLTSAQHGAASDGAANQGQRERAATAREWDRPETSKQSRDEQRESARQGAGQRGQRGTPNGSAS